MTFFDLNFEEKFSLKYDNVPKDYDISQMQYTFDFIEMVLKQDAEIDNAIDDVAGKYGLSRTYLNDFLVKNKYILNKTKRDEFSEVLKQYSTKFLKKILKQHGLKTTGKRERIEKRIYLNNLLGTNYYLSSKSKIFYKNKKRRMKIYDEYLKSNYYFDEFNEYYMDNFRKKVDKIPVEFIKKFIDKASDDENQKAYERNSTVMAELFYKRENYKNMLQYVLKDYSISLNPVWDIDDLKNHDGISHEIYDALLFLKEKVGKNRIIQAYFVIWDSFNFDTVIVPKYVGYRYIKDILNSKDYSKITQELKSSYYMNEDLKIKRIIQKTLFDF